MKGKRHVEFRKCVGCHSCELACALEHSDSKDLVRAINEDPLPVSRVHVERVGTASVPLQCRHCEDAPCVAICPREAIEKLGPEQAVVIHEDKCTGCKFCIAACPFGVVLLRSDGKAALKCDLCPERTEEGLEPACVNACPNGALCLGSDKGQLQAAQADEEQT